jgi:hypothetical protein
MQTGNRTPETGAPGKPGETVTMKTTKSMTMRNGATNYEGRFFGMIVLAWIGLTILFNVLHRELPQPRKPTAGATAKAAARSNDPSISPKAGDTTETNDLGGN